MDVYGMASAVTAQHGFISHTVQDIERNTYIFRQVFLYRLSTQNGLPNLMTRCLTTRNSPQCCGHAVYASGEILRNILCAASGCTEKTNERGTPYSNKV